MRSLSQHHLASSQMLDASYVDEGPMDPSTSHLQQFNKKERVKWTPDLHQRFQEAVDNLGGLAQATPKVCG